MNRLRFWLLTLGFDLYWAMAVGLREGAIYALLVLAIIAWLASDASARWRLLAVAMTGVAMDSLWLGSGLFQFSGASWIPLWMLSLWLVYACWWRVFLLRYPLNTLWLAAIGAIGGPLSYFIGERLGGMQLTASPLTVFALLALGWAIYLPLTRRLLHRSE